MTNATTPDHSQPDNTKHGGRTILYIENNESDVVTVRQALENFMPDARLVGAPTMQEAEAILTGSTRTDLILLNLDLPDTADRAETFTRVERLSRDIPVLLLAGKSDYETLIGLVNSGADNYIRKSAIRAEPEMLRDAIDIALCHHRKNKSKLSEKDQVINWMCGGYSVQRQG